MSILRFRDEFYYQISYHHLAFENKVINSRAEFRKQRSAVMTKNEVERYSKRFVALGIMIIGVGLWNWFRWPHDSVWAAISFVGCIALGIMQFRLAHQFHKKAQ